MGWGNQKAAGDLPCATHEPVIHNIAYAKISSGSGIVHLEELATLISHPDHLQGQEAKVDVSAVRALFHCYAWFFFIAPMHELVVLDHLLIIQAYCYMWYQLHGVSSIYHSWIAHGQGEDCLQNWGPIGIHGVPDR